MSNKTHVTHYKVRVYYEDTDAGGVVYHASFIRFTERARTEWLRDHDLSNPELVKDHSCQIVVRHLEADYKAPAYLDDHLDIQTSVTDLGNASFTMQQSIMRDGKMLVDMKVVLVCVSLAGKAVRVPEVLRQRIET